MLAMWWTDTAFPVMRALLPVVLWMAFWVFAVNWKTLWPVLREGAWAPLVLLGLLSAIVWAQLLPDPCCAVLSRLPNFWWQLLCVSLLIGCALFSGWLQGLMRFSPVEVSVEPPAHHDHGHGHGHGHDHGHAADHHDHSGGGQHHAHH